MGKHRARDGEHRSVGLRGPRLEQLFREELNSIIDCEMTDPRLEGRVSTSSNCHAMVRELASGLQLRMIRTQTAAQVLPSSKRYSSAPLDTEQLSFESASHGAGRRMSRTEAKRSFNVADLERQTQGVECRKDRGVLDEAPKAYKNIDRVMAQQEDLVDVVAELKQVLCVKG